MRDKTAGRGPEVEDVCSWKKGCAVSMKILC